MATMNGSPKIDPDALVDAWLTRLDSSLASGDPSAAANLFEESTSFWRDLIAFTWNIVTVEGRSQIHSMLESTLESVAPKGWTRHGTANYSADSGVIEAWIKFETRVAVCTGHLRLVATTSLCRTLLTAMEGLRDFPEKKGRTRPNGVTHGVIRHRASWLDGRKEDERTLGSTVQPYCVIVGGGQAGIGLAARLRQLGVPCIVVEKNPRPGDSWRNRYKSLCLHDPVWYDHLPYLPFPENWPIFAPKDKMGDWLEAYTKIMEINYWTSSECLGARLDPQSGEWEVKILRDGSKEVTLRPKQLILATGMSGFPNVPRVPGQEEFVGDLHHSSKHPGGEAYKGKRAVILGSNNSAHDIAADLWENGAAEVTMIQRSSSHVVRSESLFRFLTQEIYSESAVESGITTDKADMIFASLPYKIMGDAQRCNSDAIRAHDKDFYAALTKTGFMLDFGDDDSGLFMKYLRRGSGYYIDVGASQLLIDGEIKLRSGVTIASLKPSSVVLSDGTEIAADVVILATGYGSMNQWAAKLISQEVADRVGKCWGLGSNTRKDPGPWEGELRNMWKPTAQEGLWFHGGNLHQARHYSLYLALQLKARMEGIATPVYGVPKVHHLS
ncbi:hypothetical protein SELMODRAFT_422043 [Selaginella moellendorffii]|uniref:indole-3-pyruvate monooxygenase n=1 Tax=Selaginella moellendorffii TaxID=88036 RepID=D8SH60_SELML|nr:probable indole-3-pyruvate monooxygenase YUCCA5 [Selaginella moellendorffii]EFJ16324.1 hypothetical protein SELMODRAFT_422043 [Selaginella moellendorffii]|eukprot:XP_002982571.1 probable indole-3-pyruvate monooxygenase YUCCA5 [Selaginella moellendorffii]